MAVNEGSVYLRNAERKSTLHQAGDKLGTYYLSDNPKYYEIQRDNNFMFYVSGLKGKLKIPQNSYAQAHAEEVLKISVSKASVPHFSQNPISVRRGNNEMKFAGVPTFGSGSIELNDYIGAGTKDVLMAWQNQSYDVRTEKVGLAADYKCDAYLLEYTPDYQLVRSWKLMGCWISELSEPGYDHGSNNKVSITAKIEYDKAWLDISDID